MTIISRSVYDRKVVKDLNMEDAFSDNLFSDRTNFNQFPNALDRNFMLNAVAAGVIPAQRTENDRIIFTDTQITVEIEWLDETYCQAWVDMRRQALPIIISCDMVKT